MGVQAADRLAPRAQLRLGQPVGGDARQRRSREQLGDRQRKCAEDEGDHRRDEEEDQQRERLPHRVEPREGGPKLVDPDPRDQQRGAAQDRDERGKPVGGQELRIDPAGQGADRRRKQTVLLLPADPTIATRRGISPPDHGGGGAHPRRRLRFR